MRSALFVVYWQSSKFREEEEIPIHEHETPTGPASKQEAGEQNTHWGRISFYCRCHDATSSLHSKICISFSLVSWILYMTPLNYGFFLQFSPLSCWTMGSPLTPFLSSSVFWKVITVAKLRTRHSINVNDRTQTFNQLLKDMKHSLRIVPCLLHVLSGPSFMVEYKQNVDMY